MSNITAYPLQDWFETTLAQSWNGAVGTVYLNTAPSFTFPSGVKTYIVVNPWKTNMQVGEIDSLHVWNKTVNVSSISVGSWAGTTYTQESHSVWSTVIISDNYQFWKNIIDAVNTKIDWTTQGIYFYADATARDAALWATPSTNGLIVWLTSEGKITYSLGGTWIDLGTWATFVNASTSVAGKVEIATSAESIAGTDVWGTGAFNSVLPSDIAKNIQSSTFIYGADVGGDDTYVVALTPVLAAYTTGQILTFKATTANTGACTVDFWPWAKSIKTLLWNNPANWEVSNTVTVQYDGTNFVLQKPTSDIFSSQSKFWGTSADWAVDGTAALTITGSNNTYIVKNYSSWAAGTAARICTVTPTNCIVHIKIKWDADFTNWSFNFNGKGAAWGAQVVSSWGTPNNAVWLVGTSSLWLFQVWLNANGTWWWVNSGSASAWGGGWAGSAANGTTATSSGAAAWGTGGSKANEPVLTYTQWMRRIIITTWAWGWSWWAAASNSTTASATGWAGGAWGGALIIEIGGNLTLDNATTVINMNWSAGSNGAGSLWSWSSVSWSWGGWGWGGSLICLYSWTLTGTVTPTVAWGAGWSATNLGTWAGTAWGAGWAWLYILEQNVVFS